MRKFVLFVACGILLINFAGCRSDHPVTSSGAGESSKSMESLKNSLEANQQQTSSNSIVNNSSEATVLSRSNDIISSSEIAQQQVISYLTSTSPNGVTVRAPKESCLKQVDAAQFGMDVKSSDNSSAFNMALAYCSMFPNTKLVIPKGVYYFNSSDMLNLKNAKNILIDGQGSEFIFRNTGLFRLADCDTVEICNLVIDWDWNYSRPANLVKVIGTGRDYIDFEFVEVENIQASDVVFETMNQFDAETLTPGCANGKEYFSAQLQHTKQENIAANVIRVYDMSISVNEGEYYLVRNFSYKSHAFDTSSSQNITYKNITIYSAPGMGFVFGLGSGHIKLDGCVIGLRPNTEKNRHISTQVDAVHCLNTSGNIWIENCDFSFMGDDGTNIHDNVGLIESIENGKTLICQNTFLCEVGDKITFLKDSFEPTYITATITAKTGSGTTIKLSFDKDLSGKVKSGYIAQNTKYNSGSYYIANNYYHENRARGILAQASNGLITGNRFFRTQGAAILVVTDISTGLWSEGTGVDTLTVSKNTFNRCNVNNWTALIDIHTNINGTASAYPVMKNLIFEKNVFSDFPGELFHISSAETVIIRDNTIKNPTYLLNGQSTRGGISIQLASDILISNNTYYASAYMQKSCINPNVSATVKNTSFSGNQWLS